MKKPEYAIGLLIGRFQPFHKGHLYLIREALKYVGKITVGIGSSNIANEENPLDFTARKKMIEAVFEKEGLRDRLNKVVPIPDVSDDDEWFKITFANAGKFDVNIGNNEWTNGILERSGIKVLRLSYHKRYIYEGKKIRELIRQDKKWQHLVPDYIATCFGEVAGMK